MFLSARFTQIALVFAVCAVWVSATQVMQRPANYKDAPNKYPTGQSVPRIIHKRSGAKANIGYFTNWYVSG